MVPLMRMVGATSCFLAILIATFFIFLRTSMIASESVRGLSMEANRFASFQANIRRLQRCSRPSMGRPV